MENKWFVRAVVIGCLCLCAVVWRVHSFSGTPLVEYRPQRYDLAKAEVQFKEAGLDFDTVALMGNMELTELLSHVTPRQKELLRDFLIYRVNQGDEEWQRQLQQHYRIARQRHQREQLPTEYQRAVQLQEGLERAGIDPAILFDDIAALRARLRQESNPQRRGVYQELIERKREREEQRKREQEGLMSWKLL